MVLDSAAPPILALRSLGGQLSTVVRRNTKQNSLSKWSRLAYFSGTNVAFCTVSQNVKKT